MALVGPLKSCRSRVVRTLKFFQEINPHGLNFPFHAIHTRCIVVQTNIELSCNSETRYDRDYIFGGPCRPFVGLSIARCPHFKIFPGNKSAWFEFPIHDIYTRCVWVQTNIKLGYNSETRYDRDYIFGGPCRPFVGLSIARCPHFEILPGNKSAWFEFPIHDIYTRCVLVQTNSKLGYNSETRYDRDYIFGGPSKTFVGLSIARCPHFEILSGNKSAWFEFPVSCCLHTLYNGANEYQTGL